MKLSTVRSIFWINLAIFWTILVADILISGPNPKALEVAQEVAVYALLSAHFYTLGAERAAKKTSTTYETSN